MPQVYSGSPLTVTVVVAAALTALLNELADKVVDLVHPVAAVHDLEFDIAEASLRNGLAVARNGLTCRGHGIQRLAASEDPRREDEADRADDGDDENQKDPGKHALDSIRHPGRALLDVSAERAAQQGCGDDVGHRGKFRKRAVAVHPLAQLHLGQRAGAETRGDVDN